MPAMKPSRRLPPIATLDEHRRSVESLRARISSSPGLAELALELERVLRFEQEHVLPEELRFGAAPAPRARRTALISDIHGNHAGLLAVLADIEAQACDRIVCLGDLVDGGPENEEVVETIRRRGIPCVRGNHDQYHDLRLSSTALAFLSGLPEAIVEEDALYVHISPRAISRKINHEVEAWNVFDETDYRRVFVGHVHVPFLFGERSETHGQATRHGFEYCQPLALAADDRFIVSVGAVGYGRDEIGKIRYAIYDREAGSVEFRAIDGPLLPLDHALR